MTAGRGLGAWVIALLLAMAACSFPRSEAERAAAAQYRTAAEAADRAVDLNDVQLDATAGTEQDFRDFYHRWADIERDFMTAIGGIAVPTAIALDLRDVVEAYGRVETILRRFETGSDEAWDLETPELDDAIAQAITASNVVRSKLGMPSAEQAKPS